MAFGAADTNLIDDVRRMYARFNQDLDFAHILSDVSASWTLDEAALADLIDADGRVRVSLFKAVTLDRYLKAVPDLPAKREALDAAIEASLRSISGGGHVSQETINQLVRQYPDLALPIRTAAHLGCVWPSTRFRTHIPDEPKSLPCEFGPPLPPPMPHGRRRYELQKLLGEGGFGRVYLARDRHLSEKEHTALVAIKILFRHNDPRWNRQRIIEEATKARRINHRNVVMVMDRGTSDADEDYIVYEFVDGGDLSQFITVPPNLPVRDAARLIADSARGVHAAHSAGVIHCDLQPGNIMLTAAGELKVADFGVAIRLSEQQSERQRQLTDSEATRNARPLGNVAFISPEQFRCEEGALTALSDVYALGGILYLLLTGELPNGQTPEQVASNHDPVTGRTEAPSVRAYRAEVDRDLEAICRRAMAPKPQDRYNSAAALAEDLDRWLNLEPLHWTQPSAWRLLGLWARRKPALAAATGLIVVLLIAASAVALHLNSLAKRRAVEAAVSQGEAALSQLKLEQEQAEKAQRAAVATALSKSLTALKSYRFSTEALPQIWALEYAWGPQVLGRPDLENELWKARIVNIRNLVQLAHEQGRDHDLETLLWESALGFWLVCDKDYVEAQPLLAANREKWSARLAPDDEWLAAIDAMQVCANVNRYAAEGRAGAVHGEALRELEGQLQSLQQQVAARRKGTPIHFMIMQSMADLYAPGLLNDPERSGQLLADLKSLIDTTAAKAARKKRD